MGVHLGCYKGCVDSHGCTLRVLCGMCIAMGVHLGCYEGCVDSHGCTLNALCGMFG